MILTLFQLTSSAMNEKMVGNICALYDSQPQDVFYALHMFDINQI